MRSHHRDSGVLLSQRFVFGRVRSCGGESVAFHSAIFAQFNYTQYAHLSSLQNGGQSLPSHSRFRVLLFAHLLLRAYSYPSHRILSIRSTANAARGASAGTEVLGVPGVLHERAVQSHPSLHNRAVQPLHRVPRRERSANVPLLLCSHG